MAARSASEYRETGETRVRVQLSLDGTGQSTVTTGVGMLDHLLVLLARHGRFDLTVEATGDLEVDPHHLVEDVGITLGRTVSAALSDRRGIVRMGQAIVPMDDALALVAIDLGGRGFAGLELSFASEQIGALPTQLIAHFLRSLALEGRMNLHVRLLAGEDDHHRAEAVFKALARALDQATRLDERIAGQVPSTKGVIEA